MLKNHAQKRTTPARTTFALTDVEVAQALADYVKNKGETVPDGNWQVWVRDSSYHSQDTHLATLVIDHKEDEDAYLGDGIS